MAHGTSQAIFGLGDENDSNSADALGATQTELTAHEADTSTHGVAQVAGTADITTHAALTTGVHGVGGSTVASASDLSNHASADLSTSVHSLPKMTVAAGGNTTSVVSGITASDTIVGCILFTITTDTGTDATGNKVSAVDTLAVTAGSGAVTYAGDKTGNTLVVFWLDNS